MFLHQASAQGDPSFKCGVPIAWKHTFGSPAYLTWGTFPLATIGGSARRPWNTSSIYEARRWIPRPVYEVVTCKPVERQPARFRTPCFLTANETANVPFVCGLRRMSMDS